MSNEIKMNDTVTFTALQLVNVLTDFYDELVERGDEIHNYLDIVAIAKEKTIEYVKEQKENE